MNVTAIASEFLPALDALEVVALQDDGAYGGPNTRHGGSLLAAKCQYATYWTSAGGSAPGSEPSPSDVRRSGARVWVEMKDRSR